MNLEQMLLAVSAVSSGALVVATAWIAIATLRGVRTQMHVQTFTEYTRRYAEILEALPWDIASPSCTVDPAGLPADQREALMRALRRYFNLCWEELHLRRSKKIDDMTWRIWEAGISDTMRSPCVRAGWQSLRTEYNYGGLGGDFVKFIDNAIELAAGPVLAQSSAASLPTDATPSGQTTGVGH